MNIIKKIIRKMQTVFFTQIACFSSGGGVKPLRQMVLPGLGKDVRQVKTVILTVCVYEGSAGYLLAIIFIRVKAVLY